MIDDSESSGSVQSSSSISFKVNNQYYVINIIINIHCIV